VILASLGQAKTLGGVGSLLLLLNFVPYAGPVLGIVGLILVLVAVKYISDSVSDRSIFNNIIWAVLLAIVGVVIGAFVVFASLFRFIGLGYLSGPGLTPANIATVPAGDIAALIIGLAAGLVAIWIFYLVSAIFMKRSFDTISIRVNVGMFHTAALIYLIGAATTIILVGFVLIFVAQILFIVAFFSIPETIVQSQQVQR